MKIEVDEKLVFSSWENRKVLMKELDEERLELSTDRELSLKLKERR